MQLSQFELEGMGKEAAAQYLLEKTPLNETIIKMAEERDLNPHQVARICEAANTDVYSQLWGMTKNGQFTFEMADQEKIAERLSTNTTEMDLLMEEGILPQKLASFLPKEEDVDVDEVKTYKEAEKITIKTAEHPYKLSEAFKLLDELNSLEKQASDRLMTLNLHRNAEIGEITSMLKEAALRGENVCLAYVAATNAFPEKLAEINKTFGIVLPAIKPYVDHHNKTASKQYTENAFGETGARAVGINSQHALIKHINNILDDTDNIDLVEKTRGYIVDKIEQIKDKLVTVRQPDADKDPNTKEANFAWDVYSFAAPMIFSKQPEINTVIAGINNFKPIMKPAFKGIKPIGAKGFARTPLAGVR